METRDSTVARLLLEEVGMVPAAIAGFVATAVLFPLQTAMGSADTTAVVIPALYGIQGPNPVAAWAIHLVHGSLLGVGFAAVASTGRLRRYARDVTTGAGLGLLYGAVLTVVAVGVLMPLWLRAVGFPNAPPLLTIQPPSLVSHLAYGVVLGALYPVLVENM